MSSRYCNLKFSIKDLSGNFLSKTPEQIFRQNTICNQFNDMLSDLQTKRVTYIPPSGRLRLVCNSSLSNEKMNAQINKKIKSVGIPAFDNLSKKKKYAKMSKPHSSLNGRAPVTYAVQRIGVVRESYTNPNRLNLIRNDNILIANLYTNYDNDTIIRHFEKDISIYYNPNTELIELTIPVENFLRLVDFVSCNRVIFIELQMQYKDTLDEYSNIDILPGILPLSFYDVTKTTPPNNTNSIITFHTKYSGPGSLYINQSLANKYIQRCDMFFFTRYLLQNNLLLNNISVELNYIEPLVITIKSYWSNDESNKFPKTINISIPADSNNNSQIITDIFELHESSDILGLTFGNISLNKYISDNNNYMQQLFTQNTFYITKFYEINENNNDPNIDLGILWTNSTTTLPTVMGDNTFSAIPIFTKYNVRNIKPLTSNIFSYSNQNNNDIEEIEITLNYEASSDILDKITITTKNQYLYVDVDVDNNLTYHTTNLLVFSNLNDAHTYIKDNPSIDISGCFLKGNFTITEQNFEWLPYMTYIGFGSETTITSGNMGNTIVNNNTFRRLIYQSTNNTDDKWSFSGKGNLTFDNVVLKNSNDNAIYYRLSDYANTITNNLSELIDDVNNINLSIETVNNNVVDISNILINIDNADMVNIFMKLNNITKIMYIYELIIIIYNLIPNFLNLTDECFNPQKVIYSCIFNEYAKNINTLIQDPSGVIAYTTSNDLQTIANMFNDSEINSEDAVKGVLYSIKVFITSITSIAYSSLAIVKDILGNDTTDLSILNNVITYSEQLSPTNFDNSFNYENLDNYEYDDISYCEFIKDTLADISNNYNMNDHNLLLFMQNFIISTMGDFSNNVWDTYNICSMVVDPVPDDGPEPHTTYNLNEALGYLNSLNENNINNLSSNLVNITNAISHINSAFNHALRISIDNEFIPQTTSLTTMLETFRTSNEELYNKLSEYNHYFDLSQNVTDISESISTITDYINAILGHLPDLTDLTNINNVILTLNTNTTSPMEVFNISLIYPPDINYDNPSCPTTDSSSDLNTYYSIMTIDHTAIYNNDNNLSVIDYNNVNNYFQQEITNNSNDTIKMNNCVVYHNTYDKYFYDSSSNPTNSDINESSQYMNSLAHLSSVLFTDFISTNDNSPSYNISNSNYDVYSGNWIWSKDPSGNTLTNLFQLYNIKNKFNNNIDSNIDNNLIIYLSELNRTYKILDISANSDTIIFSVKYILGNFGNTNINPPYDSQYFSIFYVDSNVY